MIELNKKVREAVARNIRKYRERAYPGIGGATKCAKALNVSLQQWSLWENGHRAPTARNLQRIARALNVPATVLYDAICCCPIRFDANAPHHPANCFPLTFWHDK